MKTGLRKQVNSKYLQEMSKKLDLDVRSFLGLPETTEENQVHEAGYSYAELYADRMLIADGIRSGIPYRLFSRIQQISPFSNDEWGRFLDLSSRTLQRYRESQKQFKPTYAAKIIELAEVTKLGLEVFDYEMEKFRIWLETPSFALGNHKPVDLLSDSFGKELVINELIRIEEGIFV